jgi:hypothetical protein
MAHDPLICHGQLTLLANRALRSELRALRAERLRQRELLQVLIFENASLRAELRAVREEMSYRRAVRPFGPLYPPIRGLGTGCRKQSQHNRSLADDVIWSRKIARLDGQTEPFALRLIDELKL